MIRQSEIFLALPKALVAAQGEFEAVEKSADNPFFKSKYADLPAIVRAASPILAKHGLAVTQMPGLEGDDDVLTTRLIHESGEWIESTMRLFLVKQDPQGQGSALTYARRYAYSAMLGIVTEADDDGNAASQSRGAAKSQRTTTRPAPRRETFNRATGEITKDPAEMTLQQVTSALEALKLPLTGNLEQKRLRLAEHRTGVSPGVEKPDPMFGEP